MSYCSDGPRCVCGGDTQRVREGCSAWVKTHPDDDAVDRFAAAMKAKLAKKRAEGYGGWSDPGACTVQFLAEQLIAHLAKGDPVDIGNFAMMLFNRYGGCFALQEAASARAE